MLFFSRLRILYKFLFYKSVDVTIDGVTVQIENGDLIVRSNLFNQTYDLGFVNCSSEFMKDIAHEIYAFEDTERELAEISCSSKCKEKV